MEGLETNTMDPNTVRTLSKGQKVWVKNPYKEGDERYRATWLPRENSSRPFWVPAEVLTVQAGARAAQISVQTSLTPKVPLIVPAKEVLLMDDVEDIDDLTEFTRLHEANVLNCLTRRYIDGKPYTKAGELLLSINPYRNVADDEGISIYDPVYMYRYRHRPPKYLLDTLPASKREIYQLPPHVFDTSQEALNAILDDQLSQYMCFLGESGSGKTESLKHAITYFLHACAETRLRLQDQAQVRRGSSYGSSYRGLLSLRSADIYDAKRETLNREGRYGSPDNPFYCNGLDESEKLVQAGETILDAFGTAGSISNTHSSRHARLTKLYFTREGMFMKAQYTCLLLDTARVSGLSDEVDDSLLHKEMADSDGSSTRISNLITNYSIFYYMLAGLDRSEKKELGLEDERPAAYRYLRCNSNTSEDYAVPLQPSHADNFALVASALEKAGVGKEKRIEIWRTLAGILHLGNLEFTPGDRSKNQPVQVAKAGIQKVSHSLLIEPQTLSDALSRNIGGEDTLIFDVGVARSQVDDLCCSLYEELYNWIVAQLNAANDPEPNSRMEQVWGEEIQNVPFGQVEPLHIGLIDCPGFDVRPGSKLHGLPSLLINHTDEKLQAAFIDAFFVNERQILEEEKVDSSHIRFDDNMDILQAIDNARTGILSMCEEASQYKRGNIQVLGSKLHTLLKRNKAYSKHQTSKDEPPAFTLHHTAADVSYSLSELVRGNTELVGADVCRFLSSSCRTQLCQSLLESLGATSTGIPSKSVRSSPTLLRQPPSARISRALDDIFSPLSAGVPWCVRCLRPNSKLRASYVDHTYSLHQLRYGAVLNTASLRHSGYSFRTTFEDFYSRFMIIAQQGGNLVFPPPPHLNMRSLCKELLHQLLQHPAFDNIDLSRGVQLGETKVFLRKSIIDTLEALREVRLQAMDRVAVKFQALHRGYHTRKSLQYLEQGMSLFQTGWITHMHHQKWKDKIKRVRTIQRRVRVWLARKHFLLQRDASLAIQKWYRSCIDRCHFKGVRNGVRLLHTLARGYIVRQHVLAMLECVIKLQRAARQFLFRCRVWHVEKSAAIRIQAFWRGFWCRVLHENELFHLMKAREHRATVRLVSEIKATWRMTLTRRRFLDLKKATTTIQRFIKTKLSVAMFRRQVESIKQMQACVRGFLARRLTRRLRTYDALADSLWALYKWRRAEIKDALQSNSTEAILGTCPRSKSDSAQLACLVDVDSTVHLQDAFPRGFARCFDELLTSLTDHGQRLVSVAASSSSCVAVVENGHVYSWGLNDRGQCGAGHTQPIKRATRIEAFASGDALGYSANSGRSVMSFSKTKGSPQRSSPRRDVGMRSSPMYSSFEAGLRKSITPTVRICSVVCGEGHSVALADTGMVFSWGDSKYGQLGLGDFEFVDRPTPIELVEHKVCAIAAGDYHTLTLLTNGTVLSFGKGEYAGLASENDESAEDIPLPTVIDELTSAPVRHICASGCISGVVSTSGIVYMWGDNRKGQCGVGKAAHVYKATALSALRDGTFNSAHPDMLQNALQHNRIVQLSCSRSHCAAVSSTGRVFVWGDNSYGQLGLGDVRNRTIPTHVHNLEKRCVSQVVASSRSTYALTDLQELLIFGAAVPLQSAIAQAELEAKGSDQDSTMRNPELVSELRSTFPVAIPINEVPGRTPQCVLNACSSTLGVTVLLYAQAGLSDSELYALLQRRNLRHIPKPFDSSREVDLRKNESVINGYEPATLEFKTLQTFTTSLLRPDTGSPRITVGSSRSRRSSVERIEDENALGATLEDLNMHDSPFSPLSFLHQLLSYCADVRNAFVTRPERFTRNYNSMAAEGLDLVSVATRGLEIKQSGDTTSTESDIVIQSYFDNTRGRPLGLHCLHHFLNTRGPPVRVIDAFMGLHPRTIGGMTETQFFTITNKLLQLARQDTALSRHPSIAYKKEKKYKAVISSIWEDFGPKGSPPIKPVSTMNQSEYWQRTTWNTETSSARSPRSPEERSMYIRRLHQVSPADMVARSSAYAKSRHTPSNRISKRSTEHCTSVEATEEPELEPQDDSRALLNGEATSIQPIEKAIGENPDGVQANTSMRRRRVFPTDAEFLETFFEPQNLVDANQHREKRIASERRAQQLTRKQQSSSPGRSPSRSNQMTVRTLLQGSEEDERERLQNELARLRQQLNTTTDEQKQHRRQKSSELVDSIRREAESAAELAWHGQSSE
eukprot:gb/GECG01000487.1/.p1 GENE.gb/GECG01000487.1/~~gb/GECG01000487.1/.p1  ORF type:complete len:2199 (+),score=217.36 gb/GECG01000487.1/:1-6597(+)